MQFIAEINTSGIGMDRLQSSRARLASWSKPLRSDCDKCLIPGAGIVKVRFLQREPTKNKPPLDPHYPVTALISSMKRRKEGVGNVADAGGAGGIEHG